MSLPLTAAEEFQDGGKQDGVRYFCLFELVSIGVKCNRIILCSDGECIKPPQGGGEQQHEQNLLQGAGKSLLGPVSHSQGGSIRTSLHSTTSGITL